MALYQGLASGRMGVVAPISGVVAAAIPVTLGIALQGSPGPVRLAGMLIALVAVVLVSRANGGGSRRDVGLGLLAGFGIGVFNIAVSRFQPGQVFAPLTIVRASEGLLFVLIVAFGRRPWRLGRSILPLVAPRRAPWTWPATPCTSSRPRPAGSTWRRSCRRSTRSPR